MQRTFGRLHWQTWLMGWQQIDLTLLFLAIALTIFGGIMIRSTELNQGLTGWWQHWLTGALGLGLALALARMRYEFLVQWHWLTYGLTNLVLIAVLLFGHTANGAQSWLRFGVLNIQPSEFAKVAAIVTMAALLHERPASRLDAVFRVLAITSVPWLLIVLQPDLGTSLVFGAIAMGMLYWGNANPGWLLLLASPLVAAVLFNLYLPGWFAWLALIGLIAWLTLPWRAIGTGAVTLVNVGSGLLGSFFWNLLKDYQKDRLLLFLAPERDPLGGGYHLIQSRIAIGAGRLFGEGLNRGTQTQLNFIPEQHTDFIFSAVGEELGFVGSICLLLGFWLLCWRLIAIAQSASDNFGSLIAVGVLSMIAFQVFVNISMTIGLAPITGIPLPWISYGRSSLLTNFIALGLVQSVANNRPRLHFR